jgi:uncharacterized protein
MNIPQLVKEKILEIDKNAEVILFGSRARGDFHEESDWDFLVLLNIAKDVGWSKKFEIYDHINDLEIETEQCIGLLIKGKKEWQKYLHSRLYKNIKNDGIKI